MMRTHIQIAVSITHKPRMNIFHKHQQKVSLPKEKKEEREGKR